MNKLVFVFVCLSILYSPAFSCSMYKVTVGDKTIVGCNEDAWRTTSKIWFERATIENTYGCAFTGSRAVGNNSFAPQSGMNENGLVFSRLASYHPLETLKHDGRKKIIDPIKYLKDILHQCKTIAEVKTFIEQYDHSYFIEDVFIYIEPSGKYLIVEPYKLIEGNEPSYVLANFCPSITSNSEARSFTRYRHGEDFLKYHSLDTTLSFGVALSDTMHVCRNRKGDGTLLTSIWDSKNGNVNLYFYHTYDTTVQINISSEIAKGDHMIDIIELFPPNKEFQQLIAYKHPFNIPLLRISLVFLGAFFSLSSIIFLWSALKNTASTPHRRGKLLLSLLGFILTYFMFILATEQGIYYFDAPYVQYESIFKSAFSYTPFLLLIGIIPVYLLIIKLLRDKNWSTPLLSLLILNTILYTILLLLFSYWGLFSVIN